MAIKFDVIDNAFDFLEVAVENFTNFQETGSARDIKYGLLHLSAAVELLLKQRLSDEHWSLVFDNVNKASITKYDSIDFSSVRLSDCIQRLCFVCGVNIEERHKKSISRLRGLRNKVEHFSFEVSREEGLAVASKVFSFALDFVETELRTNLTNDQTGTWEEIKESVQGIENFVGERRSEVERQVAARELGDQTLVDCPRCLELALVLDYDERECLFCRFAGSHEEVFGEWMTCFYGHSWTDPKERMIDDPVDVCPSCGDEYYVRDPRDGGMTPPDPAFICFRCGYTKPPTVDCSNCETEFTPDNWEDFPWLCDECRT